MRAGVNEFMQTYKESHRRSLVKKHVYDDHGIVNKTPPSQPGSRSVEPTWPPVSSVTPAARSSLLSSADSTLLYSLLSIQYLGL